MDEFDGTAIDESKWAFEIQKPGWVNEELQSYTCRKENARVENGHLVLISGDTTQYVHAHPPGGHSHHHEASPTVGKAVSAGPEVAFMASFPRKGNYASWMQFHHQGKVHTVPFVLDVR